MRIIVIDFISLDGVVQAPGGEEEDTDGGFRHGGWSMPYFDPEVMGSAIGEVMDRTEALLFGRRTWDGDGVGVAGARRRSLRGPDERHPEVRRLADADAPRRRRRAGTTRRCSAAGTPSGRSASCAAGAVTVASRCGAAPRWRCQLVEHDLVDEYRLMIEPILLGGGKTIFPSRRAGPPPRAAVGDPGPDRRAGLRLPPRPPLAG